MQDAEQTAEKALFVSANEDYCGLYEAIWELNTLFPEMPLGEKYRLAQAGLESLLVKGFIQLERRTTTGKEYRYEALNRREAAAIFSNPASWYPEYPENIQIGFYATEKGRKAWQSRCGP